ncbi:MAG: cation diffusion facilitator family transporter [Candidatus Bathyarchaeota archaeon]
MEKQELAAAAVVGGLVIFAVKLYSYFISGSVALLSDALESIVNILASLMMLVSIRVSLRPPDESHRYGHQKVENISSFVEGALVLLAGLLIGREAVLRLFKPVAPMQLGFAVLLSLVATAMNGGLSWLLMRKAKETGSMALEGDAMHLLSDVVSSVGVAAGLLVADRLSMPVLDPVMALVVAVLVLRMGVSLLGKSSQGLMDHACPESEKRIMEIMNRHRSQFLDFHNLKTRRSGDRVYAELHMRVDGDLSVQEAHDLMDHLEADIRKEVPGMEITMHVEPPREKTSD